MKAKDIVVEYSVFMIETAPHFKMGFIDIAAGSIQLLIVGQSNCNLLSIGKPEKLIVAAVNETNILAGFLDVLIQPFGDIAEAVEVIVALLRIATDQESVVFGIYTKTILGGVVSLKGAVWLSSCKAHHAAPSH